MPKLIVKPTINFLSSESDADLAVSVGAIVEGMTDNPSYVSPTPSLDVIAAALAAFRSAMADAALGGVVLTMAKNARRAELVSLVKQLANYVATACGDDLVTLLGSNFPIHKPTRDPVGQLDTPRMPVLSHGSRSGEMNAATKSVRGVFIYNWTLALASAPETVLQSAQSTGTKVGFTGLTPGERYQIAVNAVGAAGATDYSDPAVLMAL